MNRLQQSITDVIAKDPDIASWGRRSAAAGTFNTGTVLMTLKPRDERSASADQIIARLRAQLANVKGIALYMQAAQDLNVGGRLARTQFQYTLQDADLDELKTWAPRIADKLKTLPQLRDVATDQQANAGTLSLVIIRDQAARFGIQPQDIDQILDDAFGQRQVAQYFTQRSSYHVTLEIDPKMQGDPGTLDRLYVKSPLTGQQVPLSTFAKYDTAQVSYLSINHQGQLRRSRCPSISPRAPRWAMRSMRSRAQWRRLESRPRWSARSKAIATRDMRNMMIVSLAVFMAAWWMLEHRFGNHGLWAALNIFFIARG